MGNFNFREDLANESETIQDIAQKLSENDVKVLELGHTNKGDILCEFPNGETVWTEAKEDFGRNQSGKWTGNVALEFMSRGKASGVLVGDSKYWIYKCHYGEDKYKYLWFHRKNLISLIEQKKYKFIANGGDKDSNTMMFIFSLSEFEKAGKEVFN